MAWGVLVALGTLVGVSAHVALAALATGAPLPAVPGLVEAIRLAGL